MIDRFSCWIHKSISNLPYYPLVSYIRMCGLRGDPKHKPNPPWTRNWQIQITRLTPQRTTWSDCTWHVLRFLQKFLALQIKQVKSLGRFVFASWVSPDCLVWGNTVCTIVRWFGLRRRKRFGSDAKRRKPREHEKNTGEVRVSYIADQA